MLTSFLLFLPVTLCIFWLILHALMAYRTDTFTVFATLITMMGIFLLSDCIYGINEDSPRFLARMNLVALGSAPCLIPLAIQYLWRLESDQRLRPVSFLWVTIPTAFLTAGILLTNIIGFDLVEVFLHRLYREGYGILPLYRGELVYTYYLWTIAFFRVILILEMFALVIWIIYQTIANNYSVSEFWRFLFRGGQIRVMALQTVNILLFFSVFLVKIIRYRDFVNVTIGPSLTTSAAFTVLLFATSYTALFGARKTISIKEMIGVTRYNFKRSETDKYLEETINLLVAAKEGVLLDKLQQKLDEASGKDLTQAAEKKDQGQAILLKSVPEDEDENSLFSRFRRLMIDQKAYLRSNLSLGDVSDELHSNKTYVSKLVNNTYNMGFPELVNSLRVEYAKQYIQQHPRAKQEEIARESGFLSSSTFNSIFKKKTGKTPKEWQRQAALR